jgi:hypothetical protein
MQLKRLNGIRKRRQTRRRVGGSNKNIVSFTFSVRLIGKGPAKAENYTKMILAWYKDTITWSSESLEDISISYNPSTGLYEGTCSVDNSFNREDINIAIEMLVDPDDDGNYPILIKEGSPNTADYVNGSYNSIGNGNNNNNNSNNYENRTDIYLIAGTVESIKVSNASPKNIPLRNIPRNSENILTKEPITNENIMVNFQGEFGHGRYYKKSTYNRMVHKINPFTRNPINKRNEYKAKVGGRKSRKSRKLRK